MKNSRQLPRSERGGLIFRVLLILAVLAMFAAAAWVVLLPSLVVSTIRSKTGYTVKISHLSANPFNGKVQLSGFVIQNPDYWPQPEFVEMRHFNAAVDIRSLFSDRFVADTVDLDVAQVVLVRDQRGKLNAMVFSDALSGESGQPKKEGTKKQEFLIKHLRLKFDKMTYVDYSGGGKPVTKEYKIGIDQEMRDVDSVAKLLAPFTSTTMAMINDLLPSKYKLDPSLLQNVTDMLKGAGKKTEETFKGLLDSLEKKKP